jgi:hypothetical protein
LTSIVASYIAKEVICTGNANVLSPIAKPSFIFVYLPISDIDVGSIINLIKRNFLRNHAYVKSTYRVEEVDFLNLTWSRKLEEKLQNANVILASDGKFVNSISIL